MIQGRFRRWNLVWLSVALLGAGSAQALWPKDGVLPLSDFNSSPYDARTVSDGAGGSIVVWWDWYPGGTNLVAQRLDAYGRKLWPSAGVMVAPGSWYQGGHRAVSDGAGGVIIAWLDYRSGDPHAYAQRIDADGQRRWGPAGVACSNSASSQSQLCLDQDGYGGAVVAWLENNIYSQRIGSNGTRLWTDGGIATSVGFQPQGSPCIAGDGAGGAYVAWQDEFLGASAADIFAQRLAADGTLYVGAGGTVLCSATGRQSGPRAVSDGAGGAYIVWHDLRSGVDALYAQRVQGGAVSAWTANGLEIGSTLSGEPDVAADTAGAMFVAWETNASGHYDLRLQHVTRDGAFLCASGGAPVCTHTSNSTRPQVIDDGNGGAIVAWQDDRQVAPDIFVQKFDGAGVASWTANGVAICSANYYQQDPDLASDGEGGAIVAWQDWRDQLPRMAAQRVDRFGNWGLPAAAIRSVRDVPGDQGGRVNLAWYASRLDPWPSLQIARYTLWRAMPPLAKSALAKSALAGSAARPDQARFVTADAVPAAVEPGVFRLETLGGRDFFWELVGSVDAYHLGSYGATMTTLWDSTAAVPGPQYFQVIAHGTDPSRFWISAPDSGRSVDNLPPAAPVGLAGALVSLPSGLALHWRPAPETDLSHYAVYRGANASFVPDAANRLAAVADTSYVDVSWSGATSWYKVTALDVHGNESVAAVLAPNAVAAAGDGPPRLTTRLEPVQPNPFNPSTRIAWSLAGSEPMTLRIHDAAGRVVRTAVSGAQPAGPGSWVWDGLDDTGRPAASGVYYVRLSAGEQVRTQKATLVK